MTFASLFTGAGGMDLGFERAGMKCLWQVEKSRLCRKLLKKHWPEVRRESDVRHLNCLFPLPGPDVLIGGDPCPIRSRARTTKESGSPDLSGFFLALVGRMRPGWVVRENVCAPDVGEFVAALDLLQYASVVVELNGGSITGQSRPREFIVGCLGSRRKALRNLFHVGISSAFDIKTARQQGEIFSCLLAGRSRRGYGDDCIFDQGRLRICTGEECERLSGFPAGWTAGFSEEARWRFCGNSCMPAMAEYVARRIVKARGKSKE